MIEIFKEDCLETIKRIKAGSIDLILQDSPFGVTRNKWDIAPNFKKMWPEWKRIAKHNAAFIFFGTQPFVSELILSNIKMFRYDIIWYKALGTGHLNANKMPMRNHEHILMFYKELPIYNPQMRVGKMRMKGSKRGNTTTNYGKFNGKTSINDQYYPQSVIDFSNGDRTCENEHPTQKPLSLIRYLIRTYSNKDNLVFDGYSGSGTTAVACFVENRNFIGSELDNKYYEKSIMRLNLKKTELTLELR